MTLDIYVWKLLDIYVWKLLGLIIKLAEFQFGCHGLFLPYYDRMWHSPNTFYRIIPADRASRGYKGPISSLLPP